MHEFSPASPARQLLKDIRAHQPNKRCTRKPPLQLAQRVDGVTRAQYTLYRARHHPAPIGNPARRGQALRQRGHTALRFQRVSGGNQQPNLIETQASACQLNHVPMALMRWVEGAAEQANPHPPPIAEARKLLMPHRRIQGRTCPLPNTR